MVIGVWPDGVGALWQYLGICVALTACSSCLSCGLGSDADRPFTKQCHPSRIPPHFLEQQTQLAAEESSLTPIRLMRICASADPVIAHPPIPPSPYANITSC